MEKLSNIIGSNLTFLRKKAGLTQLEFGEKFNYSDKTVSRWEQGDVMPSVDVLKDIADYYGVSVDYILKEHNSDEDFFSIVKKVPNAGNKILIISFIIMILFAIAVTIHVASIFDLGTADIHVNRFWTVYLWTVPLSCLLIAFFVKRTFHSKTMMLVWLSVFVWTILAAAFISFLYKGVYWFLFFIGVPFQAAIILMARIKQ